MELLESRLSLSMSSAVDSVRESEIRAIKDLHARMDGVQSVHSDVDAMRRHVASLESDIARLRETHVSKLQVCRERERERERKKLF